MRAGRPQDRRLIRRRGRKCTWYQAVLCPCQQYDGAQAAPCTSCERGYLYEPPKKISALIMSDDRREEFDLAGAWERGEARATFDASLHIGQEDKIVVQDFPIRDSLVQERGEGTKDTLRLPIIDLLVVRGKEDTYTKGTDFQLVSSASDESSQIEWLNGGRAPQQGEAYSLLCLLKTAWIAQSHSMSRSLGPRKRQQLPGRVRLLRFDRAVSGEGT